MPLKCRIKFESDDIGLEQEGSEKGLCWLAMFRCPLIVLGFPILRRPEAGTGLEMPLQIMAAMVQTSFLETFASKLFLKGFSSMLVPTRQSGEVVFWHHFYKKQPHERVSYLQFTAEHADVGIFELEGLRHIIGWCAEARFNIGRFNQSPTGASVRASGKQYTDPKS
jgi:hypothetical protein